MIKIGDIIISNLFIGSTQVSKVYLGDVKVWPITTETNYVTFTAQQDNSSIGLNKLSTNQTLEYSTDTVTWNTFNTSTNISLNNGDKVYVRGKLNANNTDSNYTQFKMSGKIAASGNTNSLWDYENPDAQLKQYCGYNLFYNCTGLIDASELTLGTSDTLLASYCYKRMFDFCTSLITAPELPATALANECYLYMFENCTSLTTAPALPATTLKDYCYNSMFYGCTSLTTAPELPATALAVWSYRYMFYNCTNLNYIKCLATDISATDCTTNWVSGVAAKGTFVKDPNATNWTIGNNGIPTGWVIKDDVDDTYVTFTAKQDNSSIILNKLSTNQTLEYSTDTSVWNTFDKSTKVSLNTGNKVYVRGKLNADNTNTNYTQFSISGKIAVSGNTNSLWDYEDLNAPLKQACGYNLFYNCTGLIDASELTLGTSDTTLAEYCYAFMFWYCRSLTSAPALPAITLATGCYYAMLYDCTSLTVAPELHATMLADGCYQAMLRGCTSLTTVPELPATTLASYCYRDMFNGCSNLNYIKCLATDISATDCTTNWVSGVANTGTFVKDSKAKWPTGSSGIPSGWTTQDA